MDGAGLELFDLWTTREVTVFPMYPSQFATLSLAADAQQFTFDAALEQQVD